jgi:hypothetical protein
MEISMPRFYFNLASKDTRIPDIAGDADGGSTERAVMKLLNC